MKENNVLALIVAYYLSKYDKAAYENLGFPSSKSAHQEIGLRLGVNPNTVKNMRDGFDPIHDNLRVGWYQRPLRPSRTKVVELFQNMTEEELREVALGILTKQEFLTSEDFIEIINSISNNDNKNQKGESVYIIRGPTGRKAEERYIEYHRDTGLPIVGEIKDKRDHGCGYDFEILNTSGHIQVEVKGLNGEEGGIQFTSKEWEVARKHGDTYFLVIVRNLSDKATFQIIQNPAAFLNPKKSVFTTVQLKWNVSEGELSKL